MSDVLFQFDRSYGNNDRQRFHAAAPKIESDQPGVIIVDNGWWDSDTLDDWVPLALALARSGTASAIVGYRDLGRTNTGTNLLQDVRAGVQAAAEHLASAGCASIRHAVLLGSAGGSILVRALARRQEADQIGVAGVISVESRFAWENSDEQFRGAHAEELDPSLAIPIPHLVIGEDQPGLEEIRAQTDTRIVFGERDNLMDADPDLLGTITTWLQGDRTDPEDGVHVPIGEAPFHTVPE